MNITWRLACIFSCLVVSILIINKIKTSCFAPVKGIKIACVALDHDSASDLDHKLHDYYHIAHTTHESHGAPYRCYFRFPSRDLACVPQTVADRNEYLSECAHFTQKDDRACYFFNRKKYARLIDTLKREPTVSKDSYHGRAMKTWQEVRDFLIQLP